MTKKGNDYTFAYKTTASGNWINLATKTWSTTPTHVGMIVRTWTATAVKADFDYFTLVSEIRQDLEYTYDTVGNITSIYDRLVPETLTYAYDDLYRLTGVSGGMSETVSYTYHPQGALNQLVSDSGTPSNSADDYNYVPETQYNAAGQIELLKLGGTVAAPTLQTDYEYFEWNVTNGLKRLKRILSGTPGDTDLLQDLRYYSGTNTPKYDAVGNLLAIYDYKAGNPQTQTFGYDDLYRLTSASASGGTGDNGDYASETYGYKAETGNLDNKNGLEYTYDPNHVHAVTQVDSVQRYEYDANGNMITRQVSDQSTNLAANPGFESSGNWSQNTTPAFPGTSYYRGTGAAASPYSGSYGYALSNHAYGYLRSDAILVSPSAQYDLYAWVRGELDADGSAGSWIIRAYYYTSSDAYISYQNAASGGAGTLTTSWQMKGGRITTPSNAAKVKIMLFNYMNSGWAAYDDVSLVPAGGGSNMVANPGFESSGNWSQITVSGFPGTSFFRSTWGTASPHSGSYGYAISNHAYGHLQSDVIDVSPSTQYDLYAWVRGELDVEDSAGSWIIRASYYTNKDVYITYQDAASGGAGTLTTSWQQKGGRITTPSNAYKIRIRLYNYLNSGWAAYDDVSLVPAGGGSNMVANPGFESSGNWSQVTQTGFPGTSFFRSTWGTASPHSGGYGYAISNHPYGYLQSDEIVVSANTQYDLYAWMRAELDVEDSAGSWILRAYFYDENGAPLGNQNVASGGSGTLTTWQQQGGRITTPTDTARLRIRLYNYLNSGWIVFDDISLKQVGVYNLSYDTENRLTGVSGAATASFVYDGDGNRVKSVESGVTTAYVGAHFEWKGSTSTMVRYYYASSQRIAMRTGTGIQTTGLYFLFGDHLGSTSVAYKASTAEITRQWYMPWGSVRFSSGTLTTDYTFTGQKTTSFGLMYYVARHYDPSLGRFSQPDSIIPNPGDPASWDRFSYVKNSPLMYQDPSGHKECNDEMGCHGETFVQSELPFVTHAGIRIQIEGGFGIPPIPIVVNFEVSANFLHNFWSGEEGAGVDVAISVGPGIPGFGADASIGILVGGGASSLEPISRGSFASGEFSLYALFGGTGAVSIPLVEKETLADTYTSPQLYVDPVSEQIPATLYVGGGVGGGSPLVPLSGTAALTGGMGYSWGDIGNTWKEVFHDMFSP